MKTIIIDAGHGGSDSGAVGYGVLEKSWNLKMSLYQYERLKELGAKVSITRKTDQTLEPMQRIAKVKNKYDYCLSNHFNAADTKAHGVEAIHSIHAKPDLAQKLAKTVVDSSKLSFRRVFTREIAANRDYYYMHRQTGTTETVILEYGFIDNITDFNFYKSEENFYRVAEAIVKDLAELLGVSYIGPSKKTKPQPVKPNNKINGKSGKRVESIYPGKLRFYNKPSWQDQDVFGYLTKGQGFPTMVEKIKVGTGHQYKVKNSKGATFYVTASSQYVKLV